MVGASSVLRVVGAVLSMVVIIFVGWVGVLLYEPISDALGLPPAALGWPSVNFLFFMALGLIGLVLVVLIWLIVAPIQRDVRQNTGPP